jgi:hypothetical protein
VRPSIAQATPSERPTAFAISSAGLKPRWRRRTRVEAGATRRSAGAQHVRARRARREPAADGEVARVLEALDQAIDGKPVIECRDRRVEAWRFREAASANAGVSSAIAHACTTHAPWEAHACNRGKQGWLAAPQSAQSSPRHAAKSFVPRKCRAASILSISQARHHRRLTSR